jgi:hypothetical protein
MAAASSAADAAPAASAEPAAPCPKSFDEYLELRQVRFIADAAEGGRPAPSADAESGRSHPIFASVVESARAPLAHELLAACVVSDDLDLLRWALGELSQVLAKMNEAYDEMNEYIESNQSGFFSAEVGPLALDELEDPQLHLLATRCRKEAATLWNGWRKVLEEHKAEKLNAQLRSLDARVARVGELGLRADEFARELAAARPDLASLESMAAEAAAKLREMNSSVALKQAAASRSQSAQHALQQELLGAEAELLRAKAYTRQQQAREDELTAAVAAASSSASDEVPPGGTVIEGDALLDAFEAGLCWRPLTLTPSCISLGFGEPTVFELRAKLTPDAPVSHALAHVELLSPAMAHATEGAPAHVLVRSAFFAAVARELHPRCVACRGMGGANGLRALVRATGLELGRLLDLVAEVKQLEARGVQAVPHRDAESGGIALALPYAFYGARRQFVLHVLIRSLSPCVPLSWHLVLQDTSAALVPAVAASSASTALVVPHMHESADERLRQQVGAIVDEHSLGFGRLLRIHSALLRAFCAV